MAGSSVSAARCGFSTATGYASGAKLCRGQCWAPPFIFVVGPSGPVGCGAVLCNSNFCVFANRPGTSTHPAATVRVATPVVHVERVGGRSRYMARRLYLAGVRPPRLSDPPIDGRIPDGGFADCVCWPPRENDRCMDICTTVCIFPWVLFLWVIFAYPC